MISFLIATIKIIFLLGFLILIHETGHFLVAKWCKVKVNEFAIGFGPTIWKKQGKETKYALRLIPLGGFVSMEGEEERSENERSFSQASIPKRIAIVVAGATVNILFGIIVYFMLMVFSGQTYISNEVDSINDGYVAQTIGIQNGDKIIQINDKEIKNRYDLNKVIDETDGKEIEIKVDRNGEIIEFNCKPTQINVKSTGIYIDNKAKIVAIEKDSSAQRQGLKTNDKIISINNEEINENKDKVVEIINRTDVSILNIKVKRGNEEVSVQLVPDYIPTYYLGVNLKPAEDNFWNRCIYGVIETKEFMVSIIDNLKQLFTGRVGVDQMMGPVGISQTVASTNGLREFIYMMALISLSLGITNLLPIPALDGGKILILLVEAIRRKPLKEQTEINIQLLGFSILIALSIYVTYNDILRIF